MHFIHPNPLQLVVRHQHDRPKNLEHTCANRSSDGNALGVEALQAEHVDSEVVRRDTLAMKWVNAACPTEMMRRRVGVETIATQRFRSGQQPKRGLVDLHHQSVLSTTDAAVACRKFREIGVDLKRDGTTVARTSVGL